MRNSEELTATEVRQIRGNLKAGISPTIVAAMFDLRRKDVRDIGANKSWRWVK